MCVNRKFATCLLLIGTFFLLHSCMKEDLSACGLYIDFKYTNNPDRTDKFAEAINTVNLFVFDGEGIFVGEWEHPASSAGNQIRLPLEQGDYTIVAWANLSDAFHLTQFQVGSTTFDEATLSLVRDAEQSVTVHPQPLYHSILRGLHVKQIGLQYKDMDFSHSVNHVQVDMEGFPVEAAPSERGLSPAPNTRFAAEVTSNNADFTFDYTRKENAPFVYYMPYYWQTERTVHAGFTLMKLESGDKTVLKVKHREEDGSWTILYEANLTELLLQNPNMDLDVTSEFNITLLFDYTYTVIGLKVNDWIIVDADDGQGGVIG